MKLRKGLCSLLLSAAILFTAQVTVFAGPVDNIKNALIRGGVPADQVSKAIEYIQKYDITDEQANKIIGKINDAAAKMGGQKDFGKIDAATRKAILQDVAEAMSYLGLQADYSSKSPEGATVLQVSDADGGKVAAADYGSTKNMAKSLDVEAIKEAVEEAKTSSQNNDNATFIPIDEGAMKKTGTNYGNMMVLGLLLMVPSGVMLTFNGKKFRGDRI